MDAQAVAYDQKSDDMYLLLTNDRSLSPAQVLAAQKGQPRIEKRFEQLKAVHQSAPVFLKNEARIEALFICTSWPCWCRRSSGASYAKACRPLASSRGLCAPRHAPAASDD